MNDTELISINTAASRGIERVRRPFWAEPLDHVKIDIIDGAPGPWTHLYCPANKMINGRDPVNVLFMYVDYNGRDWVPYDGPVAGSDEYRARAAEYKES